MCSQNKYFNGWNKLIYFNSRGKLFLTYKTKWKNEEDKEVKNHFLGKLFSPCTYIFFIYTNKKQEDNKISRKPFSFRCKKRAKFIFQKCSFLKKTLGLKDQKDKNFIFFFSGELFFFFHMCEIKWIFRLGPKTFLNIGEKKFSWIFYFFLPHENFLIIELNKLFSLDFHEMFLLKIVHQVWPIRYYFTCNFHSLLISLLNVFLFIHMFSQMEKNNF